MRRPLALVTVVIAMLAGAVQASAPIDAQYRRGEFTLEPTPLEALATAPDAQTNWSKYIGRLEGGDNYMFMTAVSIGSTTTPGKSLRGVRIDLRHDGPARNCWLKHVEWTVMCERENAAVFIEEDRLDAVRAAVRRGHAEAHPGHEAGITTFGVTAGGTSIRSGVLFCGYELPGRSLDEVAAMLDTATALLQAAPR